MSSRTQPAAPGTPAPAPLLPEREPDGSAALTGKTEVLSPQELDRLHRAAGLAGPPPAGSDSAVGRETTVTTPTPARDPRDDAGEPFGRYRLLALLGEGGMGRVWKAWDLQLRRIVALKQIHPDGTSSASPERFLREARIAARLHHPHIVAVHDAGTHAGRHYLTCDYVEGEPLSQKLRSPIARHLALTWILQVAEALHYAHEQGVVHRDIKPDNILIDGQGQAFVTDFGLAREIDMSDSGPLATLTVSGAIIGTPRYMSPEQASGTRALIGPTSDQFSLGAVLYESIVGRPPFGGATLRDLLNATVEQEPPRPRSVDPRIEPALETVCLKALAKDPTQRYPTVRDLAADLERVRRGEPIQAQRASLASRIARRVLRRRSARISAPAFLVLLALAGWGLGLHLPEKARLEAELARARAEEAAARARAQQDLSEALALLEQGRPALDRAARAAYRKNTTPAEYATRIEAGRRLIEQAAAKAPQLAAAHYLLGAAWELEGWEDRAEAAWRQAIERDPAFGPAHFRLGRLLLTRTFVSMLGITPDARMAAVHRRTAGPVVEEAIAELDAALQGEVPAGFADEGRDWKDLGDAWRAVVADRPAALGRICREAIARDPEREGSEEFYWMLAQSVEDPGETLTLLDHALAIRPGFPLARLSRARARFDRGDLTGSLADLESALAFHPRFREAFVNRGVALQQLDRPQEALAAFDGALAVDPTYAPARAGRAAVLHRLGRLSEAHAEVSAAIAADPEMPGAWSNRGNVRYALGDVAGARADWEEALKLDPAFLAALGNVALAHLEQGETDASIEKHEALLHAAPPDWPGREDLQDRIRYSHDLAAQRERWRLPPWACASLGASLAWQFGDYAVARAVYERSLAEAGPTAEAHPTHRPFVLHAHMFLARAYALLAAGRLSPAFPLPADAPEAGKDEECRNCAFTHLESAFRLDRTRARELLQHDELATLRTDPRWAEMAER